MITKTASALLGAAVGLVTLAGAAAAAPTIAGNFYQEQILGNCSNKSSCELMFTAVPAGKSLVVTDSGCVVTMTSTASIAGLSLSGRTAANQLISRTVYPLPVLVSNFGGSKRYQAQNSVRHIMLAGEKPRMFVGASAAAAEFVTICSISGILN